MEVTGSNLAPQTANKRPLRAVFCLVKKSFSSILMVEAGNMKKLLEWRVIKGLLLYWPLTLALLGALILVLGLLLEARPITITGVSIFVPIFLWDLLTNQDEE